MQLSFLPVLEAKGRQTRAAGQTTSLKRDSDTAGLAALPAVSRPTPAQIQYLKRLTRIRADGQLKRYVARKVGKAAMGGEAPVLTKQDFAVVIDRELHEKHWAA